MAGNGQSGCHFGPGTTIFMEDCSVAGSPIGIMIMPGANVELPI